MSVALRSAVALAAVALAGCDAAPGFAAEARPPTLGAVAITPDAFALDGGAPTATVPLVVSGTLDADGPVEIRVLVRYAETDSLIVDLAEEVPAGGAFSVDAPFAIPRGATGDYAVRVSTEGADGRAGDQAAAVVRFSIDNLGPPVVTVNAPAPVTRPAQGATASVPLRATVSDPDGRLHVAAVVAQLPDGGGTLGRLFDDGANEDATAGDGVFSAAVVVTSAFEPGTYTLEIVAFDRSGAQSEPTPFTFEVR